MSKEMSKNNCTDSSVCSLYDFRMEKEKKVSLRELRELGRAATVMSTTYTEM